MWRIYYTKHCQKDAKKIKQANLEKQVMKLIDILKNDPYKKPPRFEKLVGDLSGSYSRRINIKHRLVYQIFDNEKVVKGLRMWTHYE